MPETRKQRQRRSKRKYGERDWIDVVEAIYRLNSGSTTVPFTVTALWDYLEVVTAMQMTEMLSVLGKMVQVGEMRFKQSGDGVRPGLFYPTEDFGRNYLQEGMMTDRHIFISYVREDWSDVKRLVDFLEHAGFRTWVDRKHLGAGVRWREAIQEAIRDGAAVVACFSQNSVSRERTHMNEELVVVTEELRLRPPKAMWFFPIRLDDCVVPDRSIGGGRYVSDIQYVDMFPNFEAGFSRLLGGLARLSE